VLVRIQQGLPLDKAYQIVYNTVYVDEEMEMIRVTYDYRTRDGFLETESVVYKEMKLAFAFLRTLNFRRDVVGKPVLERI